MAVAFDASSEYPTGTAGHTGASSFSWTHTPTGTLSGVLIFINSTGTGSNVTRATSVTYGGVNAPEVTAGRAADTATELGAVQTFFLGSGVLTGAQTVVVNRADTTTAMYATAIGVTAAGNTEVYAAGIVLLQEDGTYAVQSVTDGSPGTNSQRFAAGYSGGNNTLAAGTGSDTTGMQNIDYGAYTFTTCKETTPGQGARNVGFSYTTSDDRAAVHLAVRESTTQSKNFSDTGQGNDSLGPVLADVGDSNEILNISSAAWQVLQSGSNTGHAVTSLPVSLTTALSSGSKLIAYVSIDAGNYTSVASVKDANNNSFTRIAYANYNSGWGGGTWWVLDTPAGDVGSTTTITISTGTSTVDISAVVQEVSGLATGTTASLDGGAVAVQTGTTTGSPQGPPTYSSTADGEYLAYALLDNGGTTGESNPGSPYTSDANNQLSGNSTVEVCYKSSTNGSETGQFTPGSGSLGWALFMVAFKLAGGPTSVPLSDTGSSAENLAIPGFADSGNSTESQGISQPTSLADSGSGAHVLTVPAFADSGQSTEVLGIFIPVALTDSGHSAEALVIPAFADAGTSTELLSISIPIALSDTGQAADLLFIPAFADSGASAEVFNSGLAGQNIPLTDTGQSSESLAVPAFGQVGTSTESLGIVRIGFPSRLRCSGQHLVDEGTNTMGLLKGFNVQVVAGYNEQTFTDIAAKVGATATSPGVVRMVLFWDYIEPTQGSIDPTYIATLDNQIAWCAAHNLYVYLDMHILGIHLPTWMVPVQDPGAALVNYVASDGQMVTEYLANRYGNPSSAHYQLAVIGWGVNEPIPPAADYNTTGIQVNIVSTQATVAQWVRNYAPDWIIGLGACWAGSGAIPNATGSGQTSQYFTAIPAAPLSGVTPPGNFFWDIHDERMGHNDPAQPDFDGRMLDGRPNNTTQIQIGGSGYTGYPPLVSGVPVPRDTLRRMQIAWWATIVAYCGSGYANCPIFLGEHGWQPVQDSDGGQAAYLSDKLPLWASVAGAGVVARVEWDYAVNQTQDPWCARPGVGAQGADSDGWQTWTNLAFGSVPVLDDSGTSAEIFNNGSGQTVSLSDSGSAGDTLAVPAFADTGSSIESLGPVLADTGHSAEALAVPAFADTGSSVESLGPPLADTGQASEALSVPAFAEAGHSSESLAAGAFTLVPLTDTGQGSDSLAVPAFLVTGSSSEALAVPTVSLYLTDSGAAADNLFVPGFAEVGASSEQLSTIQSLLATDTGHAADTLAALSWMAEQGQASAILGILGGFAEAGAGSAALGVTVYTGFPGTVSVSDTGHRVSTHNMSASVTIAQQHQSVRIGNES